MDKGTDTQWIKAAESQRNGNCVEMRQHQGKYQVRDSKNPDQEPLSFTRAEFHAWVDGAKNGEFDSI